MLQGQLAQPVVVLGGQESPDDGAPVAGRLHPQVKGAMSGVGGEINENGGVCLLQQQREIDGKRGGSDAAAQAEDGKDNCPPMALTRFEELVDLLQECGSVHGLRHVQVGASLFGCHSVDGLSPRRQDDDGHVFGFLVSSEFLDHLVTVHLVHHDIHDGQIRSMFQGQLEPLLAVRGEEDLVVSATVQDEFQHIEQIGVIVNYQNTGHNLPSFLSQALGFKAERGAPRN